MDISRKIWNIVSIACTVIVAVGAIFTIWTQLINPSAKLSAVVKYSRVNWPPGFDKMAYKFRELMELDNIHKTFNELNMNPVDPNISRAVRDYLMLNFAESYVIVSTNSQLFQIQITNKGKRICKGVSVKLPSKSCVEVVREDDTREILRDDSVITIGVLKPKESVSLNAWSNDLFRFYMDDVRITHDLGVASIDFIKPVGYLGRWVDKYAVWFGLIFGISILLVMRIRKGIKSSREKEVEEKAQEYTE